MSRREADGTIIIENEAPNICELCGAFEELRPYGPKGERICFDCGQKDLETTEKMCGIVLFGDKPGEHTIN